MDLTEIWLFNVYKVVVQVLASIQHSAALTQEGELYTWGDGNYERLGKHFYKLFSEG